MSCTVIAVPYALAWVIGAVATATAAAVAENKNKNETDTSFDFLQEQNCTNENDFHTITAEHFMEKDFETPFVDCGLLAKTLSEHGAKNINRSDLDIFCSIDNYNLTFKRKDTSSPFTVRISSMEQANAEEKLGDLNSEYAMNVQEDAYLHLIDKLKENNMSIEEEVVEDDNTIVLTVNIEQ